jgi:hypothetical protein
MYVLLLSIFDNHLAVVLCVLTFSAPNICLDTANPLSEVTASGRVETIRDVETKRIVGFVFLFDLLQRCLDLFYGFDHVVAMLFEATILNYLTVTSSTNHGTQPDVIKNKLHPCWAVTLYPATIARWYIPIYFGALK